MKAGQAWAVLVAEIVAYELLAARGQLLSEGVDRALERRPWLTRAVVVYVAAHLLNLVPPRIDPLHRLATLRVGSHHPNPESPSAWQPGGRNEALR